MNCKQDRPVLASKPSYVSTTSAASATSAGSTRSGGSRLLFGEIDTSSERSTDSYASVCSLVLCDSSTFLKFWLADECRDRFLAQLAPPELKSLRLVCHDFSVRAAPALFNDLHITFKTSTFTRPARLAALDRVGFHVHTVRFHLPHSEDTFLPPLVDPDSGAELSLTYTPLLEPPTSRQPKYGDWGTTEILTRQYPPLFHAATNVPAFIRAFSALVNLTDLHISCPGYDVKQRYRRSIVDFALISLRIAIERNHLNALDRLTLSPIHPGSLLYLSPALGYGATPRSARCWSRIRNLSIRAYTMASSPTEGEPDHFKLLQAYLRNFSSNLNHLDFHWLSDTKGIWPVKQQLPPISQPQPNAERKRETHPACRSPASPHNSDNSPLSLPHPSPSTTAHRKPSKPLHFPQIKHIGIENATAAASEISAFVATHKRTLEDLNLEDIELTHGNWDDALAPLLAMQQQRRRRRPKHDKHIFTAPLPAAADDMAEIPIMLSPTSFPAPMHRLEVPRGGSRRSGTLRVSRFLSSMSKKLEERRGGREGAAFGSGDGGSCNAGVGVGDVANAGTGCPSGAGAVASAGIGAGAGPEGHLFKKVLRGSLLPWR